MKRWGKTKGMRDKKRVDEDLGGGATPGSNYICWKRRTKTRMKKEESDHEPLRQKSDHRAKILK